MNNLSISQLEQFSGIKAHTIRIWEQRYHALKPNRSEGNTRSYDGSQLRRLLNIVSLMHSGYKVSELASLPDEKIFGLLNVDYKMTQPHVSYEYFISQMITAGMSYDEGYFEKMFSNALLRFGMKGTYVHIICPMLIRIGLLWSGNVLPTAQEHFISNMIRQKICAATDSLPPATNPRESWLLFLPEDEFHEIGLLFAAYLIRLSGRPVLYLGSNVPGDTLKEAVKDTSPSHLMCFMVNNNLVENTRQYITSLSRTFRNTQIIISGNKPLLKGIKDTKNTHIIESVDELQSKLL